MKRTKEPLFVRRTTRVLCFEETHFQAFTRHSRSSFCKTCWGLRSQAAAAFVRRGGCANTADVRFPLLLLVHHATLQSALSVHWVNRTMKSLAQIMILEKVNQTRLQTLCVSSCRPLQYKGTNPIPLTLLTHRLPAKVTSPSHGLSPTCPDKGNAAIVSFAPKSRWAIFRKNCGRASRRGQANILSLTPSSKTTCRQCMSKSTSGWER